MTATLMIRIFNFSSKPAERLGDCFEDLRCFSDLSVISRLEAGEKTISEIVEARPGIEPLPPTPQAKSLTITPPLLPPLNGIQ